MEQCGESAPSQPCGPGSNPGLVHALLFALDNTNEAFVPLGT